jgi:hypothetical protein
MRLFQTYQRHSAGILWTFVIAQTIFLLAYYDNNRRPDIYHYIDNEEILLQGSNPYIDGTARWGAFGPLIFIPFSRILNETQISQLTILASIISILLFLKHILAVPNRFLPKVTLVLLCLSPVRELFALGQLNAICIGLISLAVGLNKIKVLNQKLSFAINLIICFLCAIAIDIKPHIILLPAFVIFHRFFDKKIIKGTLSILALSHTLIDITTQRFLELDWFESLYRQANGFSKSESKNILGLLANSGSKYQTLTTLGSVVLILFVLVWLYRKRHVLSFETLLILVSLCSFGLPYFHFYDLLIAVLVFVPTFILRVKELNLLFWIILFLLTIPQELGRGFNVMIFLIVIAFVLLLRNDLDTEFNMYIMIQLLSAFVFYCSLLVTLRILIEGNFIYQAVLNTILTLGLIVSWVHQNFRRFT